MAGAVARLKGKPMDIPQRYESLLRTALEVAAERFDEHARTIIRGRIADQFRSQAADCRAIIAIIDDGSACDDGRPHDWAEASDERRPTVCRRCNAEQGD
jgi:hypothetical protein